MALKLAAVLLEVVVKQIFALVVLANVAYLLSNEEPMDAIELEADLEHVAVKILRKLLSIFTYNMNAMLVNYWL